MQRHQPLPAKLRVCDRDHARGQVDVLSLKRDCLPDPHARDGEQAQQRLVARRPDRRAKHSGCLKQSTDLLLRPQVGGGPALAGAEHIARWHLGLGIDRLHVERKRPCRAQPLRPLNRLHTPRQLCPGDREIASDRDSAGSLEIGGQLRQHLSLAHELEPQRAAQTQILINVRLKAAHRGSLPGHGWANSRRRSRSTRA